MGKIPARFKRAKKMGLEIQSLSKFVPKISISTHRNPRSMVSLLKRIRNYADDSSRAASRPCLAVDLEGEGLSRSGKIHLVNIYNEPEQHVYIIDVNKLRRAAFDTKHPDDMSFSLRTILESPIFTKLFLDCRNDSEALYGQYNIDLQAVEDVQIMEHAAREGLRDRNFTGLTRCIKKYLPLSDGQMRHYDLVKTLGTSLYSPKLGGSHKVFKTWPLERPLINYCVSDLRYLPQLRDVLWAKLSPAWRHAVEQKTRARVLLTQSRRQGKYRAEGQWPSDEEIQKIYDSGDCSPDRFIYKPEADKPGDAVVDDDLEDDLEVDDDLPEGLDEELAKELRGELRAEAKDGLEVEHDLPEDPDEALAKELRDKPADEPADKPENKSENKPKDEKPKGEKPKGEKPKGEKPKDKKPEGKPKDALKYEHRHDLRVEEAKSCDDKHYESRFNEAATLRHMEGFPDAFYTGFIKDMPDWFADQIAERIFAGAKIQDAAEKLSKKDRKEMRDRKVKERKKSKKAQKKEKMRLAKQSAAEQSAKTPAEKLAG